jgi:hypothetical protein
MREKALEAAARRVVRELNEWVQAMNAIVGEADRMEVGFWVDAFGEGWRVKGSAAGVEFDLFEDEETGAVILQGDLKLLDDSAAIRLAILRQTERQLVGAAAQLKLLQSMIAVGGL